MDWVCYRSHFPEGYFLFLDQVLTEPRRGIPSVALTVRQLMLLRSRSGFSRCVSQHQEQGLAQPVLGTHDPTPTHVFLPFPSLFSPPPQILEIN